MVKENIKPLLKPHQVDSLIETRVSGQRMCFDNHAKAGKQLEQLGQHRDPLWRQLLERLVRWVRGL